jgi:hypothetical protein
MSDISYVVTEDREKYTTKFYKNKIHVVTITHYKGFLAYVSYVDKWYRFQSFYFELYANSWSQGRITAAAKYFKNENKTRRKNKK